jgi:predicted ATP-binding protein involved in virulence
MADRSPQSLSANPDDSGYRRGSAGRRRTASSGSGGGRSLGVNLMLAVLVAGLMVAGWFIANQHQLLTAEKKSLDAAESRIALLEERLRMTDETLIDSEKDTEQQIGFWETEIRKLWAVSNDRNKKWIKDNEAAVAKLTKTLGAIEASNRELGTAIGRHEAAFKQQQAIIDQLTSMEIPIQQLANTQREMVDKVNSASQSVASLNAGLANRVQENEQAVAAIDAYRVQVNTRLANIERKLDGTGGAQL